MTEAYQARGQEERRCLADQVVTFSVSDGRVIHEDGSPCSHGHSGEPVRLPRKESEAVRCAQHDRQLRPHSGVHADDGSLCVVYVGEQAILGMIPTRELLEELRLRGDLLMTVMPTTPRGQDGSMFSALATALLKATTEASLEADRGH
jgi:hypothetical protein